jgi:Kef-type K+ transport system membrane component KefB
LQTETVTTYVIGDVTLIVAASTLLGAVARRLGQPTVVGQIIAGIALGPTLLGRFPGDPTARIFPVQVQPFLSVLSQIAVAIFMFVAGYEIDFRLLRHGGRGALSVGVLALVTPMALTLGAVTVFHGAFSDVDPHHTGTRSFTLFLAVATSITALPVLAAIVRERGMAGTVAGTVSMAAAGFMDAGAWLLLAVALAGTGQATHRPWPVTLVLLVVFAAAMFGVVRPLLAWWIASPRTLLSNPLPLVLVLVLAAAWVTSRLGLHPVFGGFLAGLTMPRRDGMPDADILEPMEQSAGLFLPLFFVTTGLSFDVRSVDGHGMALLVVILVVATAGKLGPGYLGARLNGLARQESAVVAALVNTRGLTELIALNAGLVAGVIDRELFTVLVLMALVTTLATGPLLALLAPPPAAPAPAPSAEATSSSNQ